MATTKELPSQRVQKRLYLKGRPFRLAGRPYLLPVYDHPEKYKVLMTSRQVEKTTTIAAMISDFVTTGPHRSALYAAARPDYVSDFSNTRFKHFIIESPLIRHFMRGPHTVDQVFHKVLANFSSVYFRSVFLSAAKARGIPVQFLAIDEMQEMIRDHLPVIEETQSHYPYGRRIYAGTPLTFDNPLTEYYRRSTQNEWAVKCPAGHWNAPLGMDNIGEEGPVCSNRKCDKYLDTRVGIWVPQVDGENADYEGWHFNQLMVPWLQMEYEGKKAWKEILRKRRVYAERLFRNEVLGEPFAEGESVLSETDVYACCEPYRILHKPQEVPTNNPRQLMGIRGNPKLFMGIDWGGVGKSRTAVCVLGFLTVGTNAKLRLLDAYIFPGTHPEKDMRAIAKIARMWKINFVAADHGNGHLNNRIMQRELTPIPVVDFHLSGTAAALMRQSKWERRYVLSKTQSLNLLFEAILTKTIAFPRMEDFKPFVSDLTSLYEEYSEKTRLVRYEHRADQTDDFAQALNLAHMAWMAHHQRVGYKKGK